MTWLLLSFGLGYFCQYDYTVLYLQRKVVTFKLSTRTDNHKHTHTHTYIIYKHITVWLRRRTCKHTACKKLHFVDKVS